MDKPVMVVGGGDTAMQEALFLTKFASRVYLIHRREQFRGAKILEEQLRKNTRVNIVLNALPVSIDGDGVVRSVTFKDRLREEDRTISVSGVFIFVGMAPHSTFVKKMLETDTSGHIKTDVNMKTSREGVFAAGDVRSGNMRQIALACGEGVSAALNVRDYLNSL
jgi:thioredoxin reductase (NADPH)